MRVTRRGGWQRRAGGGPELQALEPVREVAAGSSAIAIVRAMESAEVHWNNASNSQWSPDAVIFTDREFAVESVLRGALSTPLRIRLRGGTVRDVSMEFEDHPVISPGRRYIMFLTERDTPTQEGSEVAWTIARYERVFEEAAGGQWRNAPYDREMTLDAPKLLIR